MNTKEKFMFLFNEYDEVRISVLLEEFGEDRINKILNYFIINGVRPPAEGKKRNPYGLIYKMASS